MRARAATAAARRYKAMPDGQPFEKIRDYFGEKVREKSLSSLDSRPRAARGARRGRHSSCPNYGGGADA